MSLYLSDFESETILVFSMYDFDSDGKINKKDVRLLLSYAPIDMNFKD
jgi:Ca2+-binding EF-hand superfamily protein